MTAPVCKIVRSQPTARTGRALLPAIPVATDLPSLIRSVNIMTDILRNVTTSLTVNNTYYAEIPPLRAYIMSEYPDWYQVKLETKDGFIFYKYKDRDGTPKTDEDQRAFINRTDLVEFRNENRDDDESFFWKYIKEPDSEFGKKTVRPFEEDFFERVVNVHWGKKLYLRVRVACSNSRYAYGLTKVARTFKPAVVVTPNRGARLIDEYRDPDPGLNGARTGFGGCLTYVHPQTAFVDWGPMYMKGTLMWYDGVMGPVGMSAQESFDLYNTRVPMQFPSVRPSVNNFTMCGPHDTQVMVASFSSWSSTESGGMTWYHQLTTTPVHYFSAESEQVEYLYEISPGDNVIDIDVSGIIPISQPPGGPWEGGYVYIETAVFSTARERLTSVHQVSGEDGYIYYDDMKLDPDHERWITMYADEQHGFQINIHRDTTQAGMQTDNYGARYSPYRITFDPTGNSREGSPPQPPIRLPLPATAAAG